MLRLNLVSEELRKEIQLRHIYDMVKRIAVIFSVFLIFISIIILVANLTLSSYYDSVFSSSDEALNNKYFEEIDLINKKINSVQTIQKGKLNAYEIMRLVFDNLNEGIKINSLKISSLDKKFIISGIALNRENLSELEQDFRKIDLFSEVKLDAINIFQKEDINFNVEITLKK